MLPPYDDFATLPAPIRLAEGETYDCGAEALHAVLAYYGLPVPFETIRSELLMPGVEGTFPQKVTAAARAHGLRVRPVEGSYDALRTAVDAGRPAIAMIRIRGTMNHFLVAIGYHASREWAVFEFYKGRKWLFTREQLEEAWEPCGFMQLEFEPDPSGALIERARALEGEGKLNEALAMYRRVDPPTPESRLGAGNCLVQSGDLAGARREYAAAYEAGLRDPELLNNLADVDLALGGKGALKLAEAAVEGFRAALGRETTGLGRAVASRKLALSLGTLGSARLADGDRAAAKSAFEESMGLLPGSAAELREKRRRQIEECEKR